MKKYSDNNFFLKESLGPSIDVYGKTSPVSKLAKLS